MSSVGEISVDIKANTRSFDQELARGVGKALDNLNRTLQTTTRSMERTFQQTAQTMNRLLSRIDGDKFRDATGAANTASRNVESALGNAAKAADAALAAVDGNDFDAVGSAAEAAAGDVVASFEGAAGDADSSLGSIDGGGFSDLSGAADGAADDVVSLFEGAADVADGALGSIDGAGFNEVTGAADGAGDEIVAVFEGAADAIDGALGSVDAGGFAALTGAADSAAGEIAAQFEGAADSVSAAFDVPLNTTGDQFDQVGARSKRGMGVAAVSIAGALGVLKGGFGFIKAGEAANTANARIEQIGTSMGLFGDETRQVTSRLTNYAAVQARRTGADRNAIKEGQALLLTFREVAVSAGEVDGNFDRATAAAIDLAAAGFGSVTSNSIQLGKALNDPIKGMSALSRSGVTFTDVEKEMIEAMVEANDILGAQDFILSAIEQQVGGTAEATRNSSDVMRESFASLKEAVGVVLVPAFDGFANLLGDRVFPALENLTLGINREYRAAIEGGATRTEAFGTVLNTVFDRVVRRFGLSATAADKFREALGTVFDQVLEVRNEIGDRLNPVLETFRDIMTENKDLLLLAAGIFTGAATAVLSIKTAFMGVVLAGKIAGAALAIFGGPLTLIVAGIGLLVAGLVVAYRRFEGFRNIVDRVVGVVVGFAQSAWPMLQAAFDGIVSAARVVGDVLVAAWEGFRDAVDAVVEPVIAALGDLWEWIDENFMSTIEAGLEFLFALWGTFRPVLDAVVGVVQAALGLIVQYVKTWIDIITPIIQFWLDVFKTGFEVAFNAVKAVVEIVFNAIKTYLETVLGVIRGVFRIFTGILTGDWGKFLDGLKTVFESIWNGIKNFFEGTFSGIFRFFTNTWEDIVGFFGRVPGRVSAIARGMFDGIKEAFRSAINFIIRGWNSLSFEVPGFSAFGREIGGFRLGLPQIPQLANGAIVRSPTLALVGEAGPEAVIPLNRPQRAQELLNQSGLAAGGGAGRGSPLVTIGRATFVTPMDADAIAQKINAGILARAS